MTVQTTAVAVPGARVTALDSEGRAIASTLTGSDGSFDLVVESEPVDLLVGKPGWPYGGGVTEPVPVSVTAGHHDLTLPPTSTLSVTASSPAGAPLPAHVTVIGIDPSPPHPALEAFGTDPLAPGVAAMWDLDVSGAGAIDLEPGSYDVTGRQAAFSTSIG